MKHIVKKLTVLLLLLLLAALVGIPVWVTYKDEHQQQLDRALITAIKKQNTPKVIALLNEGANANARDIPPDTRPFWQRLWAKIRGKTPSMAANAPTALWVHLNTVYLKSVEDNTPRGAYTPEEENTSLLETLLKHGADVNARNADRAPPLALALTVDLCFTAERLIQNGADITWCDEVGETLLMLACKNKCFPVVKMLLAKGANVNVKEEQGDTALIYAAEAGNPSVVKLLVQAGANVNAYDVMGRTSLISAAENGDLVSARFLLQRGADINVEASPPAPGSALMAALTHEHLSMVKLLVKHGADVNTSWTPLIYHAKTYTPLSWAEGGGQEDIVQLLKKAGARE